MVLTTGQPQPALPSFYLPPPPKDARVVLSLCRRINYLVMGRSVLAGVVAQGRCFSDCSSCYVLSLGFVHCPGLGARRELVIQLVPKDPHADV